MNASSLEELLDRLQATMGGTKETEENELTVTPSGQLIPRGGGHHRDASSKTTQSLAQVT